MKLRNLFSLILACSLSCSLAQAAEVVSAQQISKDELQAQGYVLLETKNFTALEPNLYPGDTSEAIEDLGTKLEADLAVVARKHSGSVAPLRDVRNATADDLKHGGKYFTGYEVYDITVSYYKKG